MRFTNFNAPPLGGSYINWEVGMICHSIYRGAIEIGVRLQVLYVFSWHDAEVLSSPIKK